MNTKMVHYAYPSSSMANKMRRPNGCYYVSVGKLLLGPVSTIKTAEILADTRPEPYNPVYVSYPLIGSKFYFKYNGLPTVYSPVKDR
jgi:hypothetical protein